MRFASGRDIGRAFERAIRRASVPIAYSAGFHPHPRISYLGAAPTGAASEAEYLELRLAARRDPDSVLGDLNAVLPAGIPVLDAADGTHGLGARMPALLEASAWRLTWGEVGAGDLSGAVAGFLEAPNVIVERPARGPRGRSRVIDVRGGVVAGALVGEAVAGGTKAMAWDVVVRHGEPAVRPDDVATAIERFCRRPPLAPAAMVRLSQGPLVAGPAVGDPFLGMAH
jgi:radical SAM-linked protein